jgi:hypothetical protein
MIETLQEQPSQPVFKPRRIEKESILDPVTPEERHAYVLERVAIILAEALKVLQKMEDAGRLKADRGAAPTVGEVVKAKSYVGEEWIPVKPEWKVEVKHAKLPMGPDGKLDLSPPAEGNASADSSLTLDINKFRQVGTFDSMQEEIDPKDQLNITLYNAAYGIGADGMSIVGGLGTPFNTRASVSPEQDRAQIGHLESHIDLAEDAVLALAASLEQPHH